MNEQVTVEQTATDVFMAAHEMARLCEQPELSRYLTGAVRSDLESAEKAIQKALGYFGGENGR